MTTTIIFSKMWVLLIWSAIVASKASAWVATLPARSSGLVSHSRPATACFAGRDYLDNDEASHSLVVKAPDVVATPLAKRDTRTEMELREEIAARNAGAVATEERYAISDADVYAAAMDVDLVPMTTTTNGVATAAADVLDMPFMASPTDATTRSSFANTIKQMMEPRAYPLFLLEKGLEIVEGIVDDVKSWVDSFSGVVDGTPAVSTAPKQRIVVLGSGWGAASLLKGIDNDLYHVTIISPRNYFLFTPMLAGASVGTVEYRSICEPVREINAAATFLEATASSIDPMTQSVSCTSVVCSGNVCNLQDFKVPYDQLVISVGAQTNTFGIPGVCEYCSFLKQVEDAQAIRTRLVNCFERSNLPGLTDEERERNLTFCVIGAGPTGIEFAAELRDFIEQDGPKYYPNLLKHVRIKVIEASNTILAPFDQSLQQDAMERLSRQVEIRNPAVAALLPNQFQLTELLLESSVKQVTADTILLNDESQIPYGLAVWAAGNGPLPITLQMVDALGPAQAACQSVARGRIAIDPWCRAIGSHNIMAMGDCTCLVDPLDEATSLVRSLPATAQVASQQGEYLARLLNHQYRWDSAKTGSNILPPPRYVPNQTRVPWSDLVANVATSKSLDVEYAKAFQFLNLGILAYTGGGSALAQIEVLPSGEKVKGTGKVGNALWRSVYLSKQVSWRNRLLVLNDWARRSIFGRDITRL
jgi:NADH dehydrogenase FAD-containing subunit